MGERSPNAASWTWKAPGKAAEAGQNLLYEPGNWGDVIKGTWAAVIAKDLAQDLDRPFQYLDPFAGAPVYPLTDAAKDRLSLISDCLFCKFQAPFFKAHKIASTAMIASPAGSIMQQARLHVFDLDEQRRTAWDEIDGARVLDITTGSEALPLAHETQRYDLVLYDPYDFFDAWEETLPRLAEIAEHSAVLIYLYNKSPRSPGHLAQYKKFCKTLKQTTPDNVSFLIGRIPSDLVLPRAFHETILLGCNAFIARIRASLEQETATLAMTLARAGAFEDDSGF